jgi:ABC-2 type transport system permease protein
VNRTETRTPHLQPRWSAANPRGGLALIRSTWLSWMQQRSFFFLVAFGWMVPPLIYLFVWSTVAGANPQGVGGMTRDQFIVYYLALILVNQVTYAQTNWTVGDVIRMGDFSRLLLYPMPPVYNAVASEIAGKVVMLSFVAPVTLLLALWLRPQVAITPMQIALFLPGLLFAWLLRFLWGYWLALLAFWSTRSDALLAVQDALVFLLAGQVAPVALLPGPLQALAVVLPFRYMLGFPVEILVGQLSGSELLLGFALQIGWLLFALGICTFIWRRGLRRYSAVGG